MFNRIILSCSLAAVILTLCSSATAVDLIVRKTPTGTVVGYHDTPTMPWTSDKFHVHDPDRPIPTVVVPREPGSEMPAAPAPSDAIVLFSGKDLGRWQPSSWKIQAGTLVAGTDSLQSKDAFGDCQLHLEWATPTELDARFMNRGNSGVLLMGKYELQIFDSWHEHSQQIYPDGQAASIYGQTPPLVNACMPPGQWQAFDIVFRTPRFKDSKLEQPGTLTMLHNGVLVHRDQQIYGEMAHREITPCRPHASKLPLVLQGHGSPIRFRNIWIRSLEP